MQTVNILTVEWQLNVKGSNIITYKEILKKSYLFFKTRFKIFSRWLIFARSVGAQFFVI